MPKFKVKFLEEAGLFYFAQPLAVRKKIAYNISIVAGGALNPELFKKLVGSNIWEFRTRYEGQSYRLLAFWDTETEAIVVATHGFSKKTDKTPPKEIEHAEKIRTKYFKSKKQD